VRALKLRLCVFARAYPEMPETGLPAWQPAAWQRCRAGHCSAALASACCGNNSESIGEGEPF